MEKDKNPFKEEIKEEIKDENKEEAKEEIKEEIKEEPQEQTQNEEESSDDDGYKEKYEDLNNKYIRLLADFDNYRKRTVQEKEELSKYASASILSKILTALDTFDRAKEHLSSIEDCQTVKENYEVAYKQLLDILKKAGMEEIEALGKVFNPNEHEAITQVPTDEYEPDTVAVVAQKGYKLLDKVLRPALVGVAKKKEDE